MANNILGAVNENDKRILLAFVLLLLLVFVIVGYIGLLVERVMKWQAKRAGTMMYDVVTAKVITNSKAFIRFGRKKNNRLFLKQSLIGVGILFFALIIYIINGAISKKWLFNPFDYKEGFGSLFFLWDFEHAPHAYFFGMYIISGPAELMNTPHFVASGWASYIIVPCMLVGASWFFVATQAHIARHFKLRKLAKSVFNPTIDSPLFNKDLSVTNQQNQNINQNNNLPPNQP